MKKSIGILSGGISCERYLSLRSGRRVLAAAKDAFVAYVIDWEAKRRWILYDDGMRPKAEAENLLDILKAIPLDCVFDAFSGREEIDGRVAALLDLAGVRYVGNKFYASFTGLDKHLTKMICKEHGLPVLPDAVLERKGDPLPPALAAGAGLPVVVKPSCSGSSDGISVAKDAATLERRLALLGEDAYPLLLEPYVPGREFCASVFFSPAEGRFLAMPVVEVSYPGEIFDAECKEQGTYRVARADIREDIQERMRAAALSLHGLIRADFHTRTDFKLDGNGAIWILEINTHPGLGACSILPAQLALMGLPFEDYVREQIEYAVR